jgi:hypothetical protein
MVCTSKVIKPLKWFSLLSASLIPNLKVGVNKNDLQSDPTSPICEHIGHFVLILPVQFFSAIFTKQLVPNFQRGISHAYVYVRR